MVDVQYIDVMVDVQYIDVMVDVQYIDLLAKYPLVLLSYVNETLIFSTDFRENFKISWKPVQWEQSCSVRTKTDAQA